MTIYWTQSNNSNVLHRQLSDKQQRCIGQNVDAKCWLTK